VTAIAPLRSAPGEAPESRPERAPITANVNDAIVASAMAPLKPFRSLVASLAMLLLVLSAACGSTVSYDYAKEPDPRKKEYEIGPLDQIKVVVWNHPELSGDVTVRPDGVVTLPLIGDVRAAGQTPSQMQREISKKLAAFVRLEESNVSVGVSQVNSYTFTVSGNVEKAGVYSQRSYVTVLEAIALAGGPNKYAGNEAYIVRGTPQRKIPIDMKRAASGESPAENLVVLRGDLIVVP
jgi:polysaccharide export outer membrane protein